MPNHFHAIIQNVGNVGVDLCVCPQPCVCPNNNRIGTAGGHTAGEHATGEHAGSPLRRVIQWFKTMTTNAYIRGGKTKRMACILENCGNTYSGKI